MATAKKENAPRLKKLYVEKIRAEMKKQYGYKNDMDDHEAKSFEPQVVFVDKDNKIVEIGHDAGDVPEGFGLQTSAVTRRNHD